MSKDSRKEPVRVSNARDVRDERLIVFPTHAKLNLCSCLSLVSVLLSLRTSADGQIYDQKSAREEKIWHEEL